MLRIQDILNQTGLKEPFVRKCIKELGDILEPFMIRGDKNSLLFDSNALVVFDRIKQHKEEGIGLIEIIKRIKKDSKTEVKDSTKETNKASENKQLDANNEIDRVSLLYEKLLKEKELIINIKEQQLDQVVKTKDELIKTLNNQILLLSDGKDIGEIKEYNNTIKQKQNRVMEILDDLDSLNGKWFAGGKRKALLKELKELNRKL